MEQAVDHNGTCAQPAPDGPGIEPRWTRSEKHAVGTAYATTSRIWFTLSQGILNEVYYPTIDRPQVRDLQYLITDGATFFHDERRHLQAQEEALSSHALGVRVISTAPDARYRIVKEVITDPHQACVLTHTEVQAPVDLLAQLKLFVLCAPHLEGRGWDNAGEVVQVAGQTVLCARKGRTWLALGATVPFRATSCGYVGVNDGWTDLADNYRMDWTFDCAGPGNIALTGELDLSSGTTFTLGLAFGETFHHAVSTLVQSLSIPYADHRERFVAQWERVCMHLLPLEQVARDGGRLLHRSQSLLLAHEDKSYPGAMIASLSIPWGEAKSDQSGLGGYHLVWTRDMVNSAMGLLAAGNTATPLRALIYLAISQRPDGGFSQNFWVDGEPYWHGVQLDEVAFPILLAWRLHTLDALADFDPYAMVLRAAGYLIRTGPATPQERWEEASGYSPSTLASNIAALTCAAAFARERGDRRTADFIQEYADFLEAHVEAWTVTSEGSLHPEIARHYIRIHPTNPGDPQPDEDPNRGMLRIANRPPGGCPPGVAEFPARDIVDAGFLELVRYGIRRPDDPLIVDSLKVVDAILKVETPHGPSWYRYNHDGYGQRPDRGPFEDWGKGRLWPLLTGERGHYELAAGRPVAPYIEALERFAHATGLLTEQVWDAPDQPDEHLCFGGPTGAAMPLMWAHAEYLTLLRSAADGEVFDRIPQVSARYGNGTPRALLEVWKPNRKVQGVRAGWTLRIQAPAAFTLHWSTDDWQTVQDTTATLTELGIAFVDLPLTEEQASPIRFTFHWPGEDRWEGRDYAVAITR